MAALLTHLRAEARRRWPAWVAIVALVGVVGGLVLGALAGARRTDTAFARMVDQTEAADVMVNPDQGTQSALTLDAVRAMPGVRRAGELTGGGAVVLDEQGQPDQRPLVLGPQDDSVMVDYDRPRVVEGHLYDPHDPTQVMVSDDLARKYHLHPGDQIDIGTVSVADMTGGGQPQGDQPPPMSVHHLTVAGVTVDPASVVGDELFSYGTVLLTHAFVEQTDIMWFYFGIDVDLVDHAAGLPAFRRGVAALAPDEAFEFQTLASTADTVRRGSRPHEVALLAFAAVVGLAGLVVCAQTLSRQLQPLEDDADVLHALGVRRSSIRRAALARTALLATGGLVLAAVLAVAMSPAFPVGPARRAEIDPGIRIDLVVLLPGLAAMLVLLLGWTSVALRRFGSTSSERVRSPGRLVALARSTNSVGAGLGIRASVTPSGGRSGPTALAGATCAIAAVVAAMVFGASLGRFVSSPAEYGWDWDAMVALPQDRTIATEMVDAVRAEPSFQSSSVLTVDEVDLDGDRVPAVGMTTGAGGPGVTIVAGRRPAAADEIALGKRTMRLLGVGIGGTVAAGAGATPLTVVGQAVFPGLGTYQGADRTELGKGALLDATTLSSVGQGFGFAWVAIDARDQASLDAGMAAIRREFGDKVDEPVDIVDEPQRPSDVLSLQQVRTTPVAIAAVLGLLAAVAFAFVLVTGVRARRRELALLKTFGFRRRDVAGTVVWQSAVTAAIAMVFGVPIGMVVGRGAWSALTAAVGFGAPPVLPLAIGLVPVAVLILASVLAVVPGRLAARTPPGRRPAGRVMTIAAPAVAPAAAPERAVRTTLALVPLLLLPIGLTGAALAVLAGGDGLDAAAIIRSALVVGYAVAGRSLWRAQSIRPLGAVLLAGLTVASLEFMGSAVASRHPDADVAVAIASLAAPLVVAMAFHALVALPDGRVTASSQRAAVGTAYAAAVAVGILRWADRPERPLWPVLVLGIVLASVGLGLSHRAYLASRGAPRQRMQWLGLAMALVVETSVVIGALHLLVGWPDDPGPPVGASLLLIAAALTASSSPRLVGRVDRLLRHAVSVAGLSAVVVAVYLFVVVGLGRVSTDNERSVLILSMVAAAVSAVLYLPARDRLTMAADRLVYGEPQDPTQALDTFGSRMTRALPMEELLLQLVELSKKHFALRSAEVWTGAGGRLVRAASVPDTGSAQMVLGPSELPVITRAGVCGSGWAAVWLPQLLESRGDGPLRIAPMTHSGQLFGLLVLERPTGDDDFSEEDDRVLTELARQVGLALQNSELDNAVESDARGGAAQERRPPGVSCPDRRQRGRGTAQDRTQPARRRPAASGGAGGEAAADPAHRRRRSDSGDGDDRGGPSRRARHGRRGAGPGPRHLPAVAHGPWAPRGAAGGRGPFGASRQRRGGGHRSVRPGHRGRRLLLLPGGDAERRQARRRGRHHHHPRGCRARRAALRGGRHRRRLRPVRRGARPRIREHGRPARCHRWLGPGLVGAGRGHARSTARSPSPPVKSSRN